jgi:hypothetical protein
MGAIPPAEPGPIPNIPGFILDERLLDFIDPFFPEEIPMGEKISQEAFKQNIANLQSEISLKANYASYETGDMRRLLSSPSPDLIANLDLTYKMEKELPPDKLDLLNALYLTKTIEKRLYGMR